MSDRPGCLHDDIQAFREAGGGPGRMWACATCHRRFYPACPTCVDVGHRGAHTDAVAAERARIAREVRALGDGQTRVDHETGYMGWDYQRAIAAVLRIVEGDAP